MKKSIKELVVISGKGGTGKTSVTASLAVQAGRAVVADCDVDAADLHLVLGPRVKERHEFISGKEAVIRQADCIGCGECLSLCRFEAVIKANCGAELSPLNIRSEDCSACAVCTRACSAHDLELIREMRQSMGDSTAELFFIDPVACEGCGVCVKFCPVHAIDFTERPCGEWMVSDTRCGPMVHARLAAAAENSGKLVSTVRREARRIAEQQDRDLILVDGPPGIGCPVIASVTGADRVLVVAEPTVSGEHDLERVLSLARHFQIPAAVCVNKWDLNPEMTERIEGLAARLGAEPVGRVRYDRGVTDAQMRERAVAETDAPSAEDLRQLGKRLGL